MAGFWVIMSGRIGVITEGLWRWTWEGARLRCDHISTRWQPGVAVASVLGGPNLVVPVPILPRYSDQDRDWFKVFVNSTTFDLIGFCGGGRTKDQKHDYSQHRRSKATTGADSDYQPHFIAT